MKQLSRHPYRIIPPQRQTFNPDIINWNTQHWVSHIPEHNNDVHKIYLVIWSLQVNMKWMKLGGEGYNLSRFNRTAFVTFRDLSKHLFQFPHMNTSWNEKQTISWELSLACCNKAWFTSTTLIASFAFQCETDIREDIRYWSDLSILTVIKWLSTITQVRQNATRLGRTRQCSWSWSVSDPQHKTHPIHFL